MGIRIHQLAKELGMTSKELMKYLQTQGHKVTNHMCTVPETVAQILKDRLPKKAESPSGQGPKKGGKRKKSADNGSGGDKAVAAGRKGRGETARRGRGGDDAPKETVEERRAAPARSAPSRKRFFPGMMTEAAQRGGGRGRRGGRPGKGRGGGGTATAAPPARPTEATIQLPITLKDLSAAIGVKVNNLIKTLMVKKGLMVNVNSYIDEELLDEIGEEFNVKIDVQREKRVEDAVVEIEEFKSDEANLVSRAPVVTFMGHVDHGKTSLLDHIRDTRITSREHGGITQHLGAYRVDDGDIHVVFIDTPGHKAFTEMRARGANTTDVAVLVVAADEGPMPQTEEAYSHIKAAGVPIIVALNKIDKPNADPNRAMERLSQIGLQPVSWGGKTEFVEVSAQTGQGIDNLLEILSLEAELLELRADPTRPAVGVALEAESNTGRGNLATILVQDGTLRIGDHVLCGAAYGKIRNMWLNGITQVEEAGPATPVQISGLNQLPEVGEKLYAFEDASQAKQIAEERQQKKREEDRASVQKVSLQNFFEQLEKSEVTELNIILKADVKGTLEAIKSALEDCGNKEVQVRLLHYAVGPVSQDDVLLADASNGIVLAFGVTVDDRARLVADEKQVEVRTYNVIYELIDDVTRALEDRLEPEYREQVQGHAEVLQTFHASRIGQIAGCMVRKGVIQRDSKVRVFRDGQLLHSGGIASLKRIRDDVKEVKEGFECGIKVANFDDIEVGDTIEAYTIVEEKRTL